MIKNPLIEGYTVNTVNDTDELVAMIRFIGRLFGSRIIASELI